MTLSVHEIRNCNYKRLETDPEFRIRVRKLGHGVLSSCVGDDLDEFIWRHYQLQRKIIDVIPGENK